MFMEVCIDAGIHIVHKMTAVDASAMWVDANISFNAARTIIRHLTQTFKHRIQVPFSQIQLLGNVTNVIEPTFDEFIFRKNGNEKIGEKIRFWTYSIPDLLLLDFEQLLLNENGTITKYGYESVAFGNEIKGVFVIIGADHGGGKSRYLVRTNI